MRHRSLGQPAASGSGLAKTGDDCIIDNSRRRQTQKGKKTLMVPDEREPINIREELRSVLASKLGAKDSGEVRRESNMSTLESTQNTIAKRLSREHHVIQEI